MYEREYQTELIRNIRHILPGCLILKNDTDYLQGIPDLLILHRDRWAMLEVKVSIDSPIRPNQEYYIDKLNGMSFAAFIYPENERAVLNALQYALST
jgi:hypothetical protein